MNKKGFTLIEILGIVVILGLLFLIVAPPVINSVSKHEKEVTDLQKQMIEDAADLYLDSRNITLPACVSINTLKTAGYLNNDIKDATEGNLLNQNVYVTSVNEVRTYTIGGC